MESTKSYLCTCIRTRSKCYSEIAPSICSFKPGLLLKKNWREERELSSERRGMKRALHLLNKNVKGLRHPNEAQIKHTNIQIVQLSDIKLINKAIANYELLGRPIRPGK
jgi:hypothetical protein